MQSDWLCNVHEYLAKVTRPFSLRLCNNKLTENGQWHTRLLRRLVLR